MSSDTIHDEAALRSGGTATQESSYRSRILELRQAGLELHALLTSLIASCDEVEASLAGGLAPIDSVRTVSDEASQTFRRDMYTATTGFEQAMQGARAESMRLLVREGGFTVASLSRHTGISTQMIRRLMQIAESG
ncbi:MAG: hypothetical protein QOI82_3079 [Actinomycetota bacterium]|nr:hypothetical protein [Actinomycetota bacterium]